MLRPPDLTSGQYPLATKPSLGYEQQLWISTGQYTDVGAFTIISANSGVAALGAPSAAQLAGAPQELMLQLDSPVIADGQLVLTVIGTDINNAAATYVATITPPGYARKNTVSPSPCRRMSKT